MDNVLVDYYALDEQEIDKYQVGDKIKVKGDKTIPNGETNFYLFNYQHYLLSKKIYYVMKPEDITLITHECNIFYKIKRWVIKHINSYDSKAYLRTFILGDNSMIDSNISKSYQRNGISHLFALSGMHVSLLTTIILFMLNRIMHNKKIIYSIIFTFLLFYMMLTNFSPSIIRATFLFILCILNKELKLGIKTDYLLILIFSLSLFYNPYYIYNNGFLFSYVISYFLIKFGSIANNYSHYFTKLFMTSFISFLASLPISINSYFHLNFLTPFINLIFVPMITIIIFPLSLLTFIFPFLDKAFLFTIQIMEYISFLLSKINNLTFSFSHLSILFFFLYYFIIYFLLNKFKIKEYKYIVVLIILLIIHYNIRYFDLYPTLSMINIGQGDAIILTLKNNKNILIDCGNIKHYVKDDWTKKNNISSTAQDIIIPYLEAMGIHKIDYAIITHGDEDHIGALKEVIEYIKVDNVILNKGKINNNEQELITKLKKEKIPYYFFSHNRLKINNYTLTFLNDIDENNENEDSLVIYTIINNYKILLMGDAGYETEEYLMHTYNIHDVDILKVGHHGSKYSSSKNFITNINPSVALISVGKDNKFGHPNDEALINLKNSKIYRTDTDGSIKLIIKKNKIDIKKCRYLSS